MAGNVAGTEAGIVTVTDPHEDEAALAAALADVIADQLTRAVTERGRATMAVSGGGSPVPLLHALATRPVPWSRVTLTLTDERWVPPDHPDGNEGGLRRHLLHRLPPGAAPSVVPLWTGVPTALDAVADRDMAVSTLRPFDVIALGFGEDAHVASLFPGGPELAATGTCVAVVGPKPPPERLSLTLAALSDCRAAHLISSGRRKAAVAAAAAPDTPLARLVGQMPFAVRYWRVL